MIYILNILGRRDKHTFKNIHEFKHWLIICSHKKQFPLKAEELYICVWYPYNNNEHDKIEIKISNLVFSLPETPWSLSISTVAISSDKRQPRWKRHLLSTESIISRYKFSHINSFDPRLEHILWKAVIRTSTIVSEPVRKRTTTTTKSRS